MNGDWVRRFLASGDAAGREGARPDGDGPVVTDGSGTPTEGGEPPDDAPVGIVHSADTVRRRIRETLAATEAEAFVILPVGAFEEAGEWLAAAVDRGVNVYCMLAGPGVEGRIDEDEDLGRYADVLRTWDSRPPILVVGDDETGVLGDYGMLRDGNRDGYAVAFDQGEVASGFYGNYVSNAWTMGRQRYAVEPPALPASYELFRSWAVAAALHESDGRDIVADVVGENVCTGEPVEFEGVAVREVRQHLVEPWNGSFPTEVSLVVEREDGLATVGGQTSGIGPYYEEYAASSVTLRDA